jgi:hypothetical protein
LTSEAEKSYKTPEVRRLKKVLMLVLAAGAVLGLAALYSRQDESKKRFIKQMVRQVPYLPARYFA